MLHDYMRRDDLSPTEIANLLGFSSLPAFSRWRNQHDDKPWLRELERTGEALWVRGDAYVLAFTMPEGPKRRDGGKASKSKGPAKLS
jgi:AraC-like DNA-binding protein